MFSEYVILVFRSVLLPNSVNRGTLEIVIWTDTHPKLSKKWFVHYMSSLLSYNTKLLTVPTGVGCTWHHGGAESLAHQWIRISSESGWKSSMCVVKEYLGVHIEQIIWGFSHESSNDPDNIFSFLVHHCLVSSCCHPVTITEKTNQMQDTRRSLKSNFLGAGNDYTGNISQSGKQSRVEQSLYNKKI